MKKKIKLFPIYFRNKKKKLHKKKSDFRDFSMDHYFTNFARDSKNKKNMMFYR